MDSNDSKLHFLFGIEAKLSPTTSTATSEDLTETESVMMVERVDVLPNQIELGDYLYNQEG